MPFRKVARVVQVFVGFDVVVDVFRFDLKKEAVRVCVQKLAPGAIFLFQLVVEKIVHQDLAVVKDRHTGVDGLFRSSLLLRMSIPTRSFENITCLEYKGLATSFLILPSHCCALFLCQRGCEGFPWFCRKQSCSLACKSSFRSRSSRFS